MNEKILVDKMPEIFFKKYIKLEQFLPFLRSVAQKFFMLS